MIIKLIGAGLILLGCGALGVLIIASHKREERFLLDLIRILEFMECELQFRATSLPDLCRQAACETGGTLCRLFTELAYELEAQVFPDVTQCMKTVISKNKELSNFLVQALNMLGSTLGRFDLEGQIKGLRSTHIECNRFLEQLSEKKNVHLRNCQTIWLCAGAALVIIFI
jgi:stage III sporulation protein AB